jgi:hypothetical protein
MGPFICRYDKNADYRLDQFEFEQLCADAGRDLEPAEAKAALSAIDENGNGYIEFNEFVAFWKNPKEKVSKLSEAAAGQHPIAGQEVDGSRQAAGVSDSKD